MPNILRLKLNIAGFNEVRNDPRVLADLMERGARVAEAAGGAPDFIVVDQSNEFRARVAVIAATAKGRRLEATHRVLTKALDAARG